MKKQKLNFNPTILVIIHNMEDKEKEIAAAIKILNQPNLPNDVVRHNIDILERHGVRPTCKKVGNGTLQYGYGRYLHNRGPALIQKHTTEINQNGKIKTICEIESISWFLYDRPWSSTDHPSILWSDGDFDCIDENGKYNNYINIPRRRGNIDSYLIKGPSYDLTYRKDFIYNDENKLITIMHYSSKFRRPTVVSGSEEWADWQRPPALKIANFLQL